MPAVLVLVPYYPPLWSYLTTTYPLTLKVFYGQRSLISRSTRFWNDDKSLGLAESLLTRGDLTHIEKL